MYEALPQAIILAGSSGSGKTTISKYLQDYSPRFDFSVSACTRLPRPDEQHGTDYYFLSVEDFRKKIDEQAFVEWEEVYPGSYYGTLKSELERIIASNKVAIFDIDVRGGLQLKSFLKDCALAVYVQAPSAAVLLDRLRARETESEEEITTRMRKVEEEATVAHCFDEILVNDVLDISLARVKQFADHVLGQA